MAPKCHPAKVSFSGAGQIIFCFSLIMYIGHYLHVTSVNKYSITFHYFSVVLFEVYKYIFITFPFLLWVSIEWAIILLAAMFGQFCIKQVIVFLNISVTTDILSISIRKVFSLILSLLLF